MLSFRISRLLQRIQQEDLLYITIWQGLSAHLPRREEELFVALDTLKTTTDTTAMEQAYNKMVDILDEESPSRKPKPPYLLDVRRDLDMLANNKQYGTDFTELVAVTLFGIATIGICLLVFPDVPNGWVEFLVKFFVVTFAATISFLLINLVDMRKDRRSHLLIRYRDRDYRIRMRSIKDLSVERRLSVMVGIAIMVVYGVLLH